MKFIGKVSGWFTRQNGIGALLTGGTGFVLLLCCCGGGAALFVRPTQKLHTTAAVGSAAMPVNRTVTPLSIFIEPAMSSSGIALASPTATAVTLPTATSTPVITVDIIGVNKVSEYVDIQNNGSSAINLSGWVLVSEKGNQRCELSGVLSPGEILRVWSRSSISGFSCHFPNNIWNNDGVDPAVLYNAQDEEVSRYQQ